MTSSPWLVMPDEVLNLRGHGGQRFVDFVSALIRAEGAIAGAKGEDILTNTRVSVADGGVDAQANVPLGGPFGPDSPSCWQLKATPFTDITESALQTEANKAESKRLIEAGFTYCVGVCDDTAPIKVSTRKAELTKIVRAMNPAAPTPRILTAGDFADWASRHPSVALAFFRQNLRDALSYQPWLRNERAELPRYVELASRADAAERIRAHVGPNASGRAVLTIAGPIGSGLSRLVAETLADVAERVIYVPDATGAVGLVTSLVNHPKSSGVLVIDRCPLSIRQSVEDLLRGQSQRFRVVALHDPAEPASTATVRVAKLVDADVQQLIDANFGDFPASHRRAFVHLAAGIPKVATVLARAYAEDSSKFLVDSVGWAEEQLSRRVPDPTDQRCLQMLSLFERVGCAGEVSGQLDAICPLFGLESRDVVRRARRLSAAQGIAEVGPRYLSVRPRLFARSLFEAGWQQVDDVPRWLTELPPALRVSLLKQARHHAHAAARDALVDWAMPWLRGLQPSAINSAKELPQLLPLVEVSPTRVGPIFLRLVTDADDGIARSPGTRLESWPSRQHVLWSLKQLLERRETYFLAEEALFRLARAEEGVARESQRKVPSAIEPWSASFRLYLSGTEVPFQERLKGLASKLDRLGDDGVELVIEALDSALSEHGWKVEGAPLASGGVRPVDWQPSTYGELWECLDSALGLLGRCLLSPAHSGAAFDVLVRHGRTMLRRGRIPTLRTIVDALTVDDAQRVKLFDLVGEYLRYDTDGTDPEYVESARSWLQALERHDLRGRLSAALSLGDMRVRVGDEKGWSERLEALAAELFEEPKTLRELLASLLSDAHHPGGLIALGVALGKLDLAARHLPSLMGAAAETKAARFVEGYVDGLASQGEVHDDALSQGLDALENRNPSMAVELNAANNRIGSSGARALRLVRAGALPASFLGEVGAIRSQPALLAQALDELLQEPADDPETNVSIAVDMLGYYAWDAARVLPDAPASVSAIWRVLEAAATHGARSHVHTWQKLLGSLFARDPVRATRIVCSAVSDGHYALHSEAMDKLIEFARQSPALVLEQLGPLLLDAAAGRAFLSQTEGALVEAFPPDLLKAWIKENGVPAARSIARYLERPRLDGEIAKAVSPLTEFVLTEFEQDDEVFQNFCSQGSRPGLVLVDVPLIDKRIEQLERFRTHRLLRLREWAEQEITSERHHARYWREHQEERFDY